MKDGQRASSASSKWLNANLELLVMLATAVILLLPLLYAFSAMAVSRNNPAWDLTVDNPNERCVREPSYMGANHMKLLREVSDEAVRLGRRGTAAWTGCRSCHVSRARFCDTCHRVVGARPDCFDCHHYPESAPVRLGVRTEAAGGEGRDVSSTGTSERLRVAGLGSRLGLGGRAFRDPARLEPQTMQ